MRLGGMKQLQVELSCSKNYASAIKCAAGVPGVRNFDLDRVLKFKDENPAWKMSDYYPSGPAPTGRKSGKRAPMPAALPQ